jgi:hypothetical protein
MAMTSWMRSIAVGAGVTLWLAGPAALEAVAQSAPSSLPNSVAYSYDTQGRLTSAVYTNITVNSQNQPVTTTVTVTYNYDAAGNFTSITTQ